MSLTYAAAPFRNDFSTEINFRLYACAGISAQSIGRDSLLRMAVSRHGDPFRPAAAVSCVFRSSEKMEIFLTAFSGRMAAVSGGDV